jgi:hypothetical protein
MTKSHDREGRRGRRTMYHGATRNGASVQLDGGRLMEKAGRPGNHDGRNDDGRMR